MLTTSQMIRIAAVAALIGLGVAAYMREAKPAPVVVTASSLVTATARVIEHARVRRVSADDESIENSAARRAAKPHVLPPWSLPVSCSKVKWYTSHFSESTLDTMRKAAGMAPPTPAQKRQARDCIAGKYDQ